MRPVWRGHKDKELFVDAESGKGHAAECFHDSIMTVTGCTYGKANIQKLYYNQMAFTPSVSPVST